jgi:hypothetical protein
MATHYPKYYFQDAVGMSESKVKPVYQERVIDFAVQNVATSDVVNMIPIPDNTLVMNVNYQTLATVTDATGSFAIASSAGGANITYVTAAVAVAAGLYGVPAAISAANAAKWYAAKDHIVINAVTVAALATGQIRVFALMMYPQPYSYVDASGVTRTYTFVDRNNWSTTAPTIPVANP